MLRVFITRCLHGTQRSLPQFLLTSIVTLHIILTATTRALGRGEGGGRGERERGEGEGEVSVGM